MSNRNYYVICDSGCKFPAMTAEQTLAAIAEATGKTGIDCDKAYITQIKEQNANSGLKFWVGTTAEYNALSEKVNNCFYILTDESTATDFNAAVENIQQQISEINETVTTLSTNTNKEIFAINKTVNTLSNDYVIETGVSGEWTFRKWKSGYCELFANVEIDFITTSQSTPCVSQARTINIPFSVTNGIVTAAVNSDVDCWVQRAGLTDETTVTLALISNTRWTASAAHIVTVDVKINGTYNEE